MDENVIQEKDGLNSHPNDEEKGRQKKKKKRKSVSAKSRHRLSPIAVIAIGITFALIGIFMISWTTGWSIFGLKRNGWGFNEGDESGGNNATSTAAPTPKMVESNVPSASPTGIETKKPTLQPTASPTTDPTTSPTMQPTASPIMQNTSSPTMQPTASPTTSPTYNETKSIITPMRKIIYNEMKMNEENPRTSPLLLNPERGFYIPLSYHVISPIRLDLNKIIQLRQPPLPENNDDDDPNPPVTLIYRKYYLETYTNNPILSPSFLSDVQHDMDILRSGGIKCILKFAYSDQPDNNTTAQDAPLPILLEHIRQLKPIFIKNNDVIFILQAGFVGTWGEWSFSTHFGDSRVIDDPPDWDGLRSVIRALLDAVPSNRIVQVRTPRQKMALLNGDLVPVQEEDAHDPNSIKSRIGHHNGCFLANDSDMWTYRNKALEYPYLERDTMYTAMGGETCKYNPPRSDCGTALEEMRMFKWSYLNDEYKMEVLRSWKRDGCYDDVMHRLGYRIVLREGVFGTLGKPGDHGVFWNLTLRNVGFTSPINYRPIQFLLRLLDSDDGNGGSCVAAFDDFDIRNLHGGGYETSFWGYMKLPSNTKHGTYELLLNLPDESPSLSTRPEYKIKVANHDINEDGTGFIKLLHTIVVDDFLIEHDNATEVGGSTISFSCDDAATKSDNLFDTSPTNNSNTEIISTFVPNSTMSPKLKPYLQNGNFEQMYHNGTSNTTTTQSNNAIHWQPFNTQTDIQTGSLYARSGTNGIAIRNGGIKQRIDLSSTNINNNNNTMIITLSGYSKSINVSYGLLTAQYSLYADIYYQDGTKLWGQKVGFEGGTHDWEYGEVQFTLKKKAKSMNFLALYRNDVESVDGVAYFDDLNIKVNGMDARMECVGGYYLSLFSNSSKIRARRRRNRRSERRRIRLPESHHRSTLFNNSQQQQQPQCIRCPPGYLCQHHNPTIEATTMTNVNMTKCPKGTYSTGGIDDTCKECMFVDCNGHGKCSGSSGLCVCDVGYVGAGCDIRV